MITIRRYAVGFVIVIVTLHSLIEKPTTIESALTRSLRAQQESSSTVRETHNQDDQQQLIKAWRERYHALCKDEHISGEDILQLTGSFVFPSKASTDAPEQTIEPCDNVFLDFGANVGDSLGKFIDSGMTTCPQKRKTPRLDLETMRYASFHGRENVLVRTSRSILQEVGRFPEDYCYYGVEGNPRFTSRLKSIEQRVMHTFPRPVQKAHFLTETVGAGSNGPTTLYLDTVNEERNFWGSSIMKGHRDVQKSEGKGAPQVAQVQGITLSTLVQKTVNKVKGAHLLIKMDIEGGEFSVLEEAHQSGVLCQYARSGVTIHLILETHRPDVLGIENFDLKHWKRVQNSLKSCGVVIQKGRDAGR